MVGPDFEQPRGPETKGYGAPEASTAQPVVSYGAPIAADWYRLFHSDTLSALVENALTRSPDLESARRDLRAAQEELTAVSGERYPQVQSTIGVVRTRVNGAVLYQAVDREQVTTNQFNLPIALSYNLDFAGGIRRSIEAQGAAVDQSKAALLNTYVTLVNQVVTTAFSLAATNAQLDVTERLIKEEEQQLELTEHLESAGKVTRADTYAAQTQLEATRASLPALQKARDVQLHALARLSGVEPAEFQAPSLVLASFTLPSTIPVSFPADLVRQRPDVLQAEATLHESSAEIGVAAAAQYPSIGISAQYAQEATRVQDLFTRVGGVWSLGIAPTIPIFNGGTLSARKREAQERYESAAATYRKVVINAEIEVADALQSISHDTDAYTAQERRVAAAAANRDLTLRQYQVGKTSELQVLIAEQQYQDALLSAITANSQRFEDVAELIRALGGGWWSSVQGPIANLPPSSSSRIPQNG